MASIKCKLCRHFSVISTRLSSHGYTEYQIEYQVEIQSDEGQILQKSKWCRFSQIKKLHRDLQILYTQTMGKEAATFPRFPRGSYFGRFDEEIINSRRLAIQKLLLFCSKLDYLYGSIFFQQFFMENFDDESSQNQTISPSSSNSEFKPLNDDDSDCQNDQSDGNSKSDKLIANVSTATNGENNDQNDQMKTSESRDPLGGIWLHKRDDGDESSDEEGKEHHSNTIEDFSAADLYDSGLIPEPTTVRPSNDSVNPEKDLIDFSLGSDQKLDKSLSIATDSVDSNDINVDQEYIEKQNDEISVNDLVNELLAVDIPSDLNSSENSSQIGIKNIDQSHEQKEFTSESQDSAQSTMLFDPLLEDSNSVKDMDDIPKDDPFSLFYNLQHNDNNADSDTNINQANADNTDLDSIIKDDTSLSNPPTPSNSINGQEEEKNIQMKSPKELEESSKKFEEIDYIYDAAKFIVQAVREESNCNYNESFILYKEGIRTLLTGAQNDNDSKRREGVKRKIEFYISHIEKMYQSQLATTEENELQENQQLPPSVPACLSLRLELRDFKVIGVIDKVLLVQHFTTEEVFIFKVLHKGSKIFTKKGKKLLTPVERARMRSNSIMKSMRCPFMVKLYRWFETANCLFLLIEHVPMGCLYDSISNYLHLEEQESIWRIHKSVNTIEDHKLISASQYKQEKQNAISTNLEDVNVTEVNNAVIDESSEESEGKERDRSSTATRVFAMLDNLENNPRKKLPESYIQIWISEVVSALSYLHSINIIWKDFGPRNILLDANGHVKLTFLGKWEEVTSTINPENIKRLYCAPEIGSVTPPTPAADWWSVGAIMFEMLTGKSFYRTYPRGLHSHTAIHLPSHISPDAQSLVKELLQVDPRQRIGGGRNGSEEIRSHPFFNGIKW